MALEGRVNFTREYDIHVHATQFKKTIVRRIAQDSSVGGRPGVHMEAHVGLGHMWR